MKRIVLPTLFGTLILFWGMFWPETEPMVDMETGLAKALELLGDKEQLVKPDYSIPGVSLEVGQDLIFIGKAQKKDGARTRQQSKHFVCTSCHNMEREDPDLRFSDPQARLLYAKKNGLPFLPGTTLYGAVNRTSFYNGDYEKKYGDLVKPARNNIREAIQLCAVECSQGRALEPWEMESVLAYLWTIELKLKDLNLTEEDIDEINQALVGDRGRETMVRMLKRRYLSGSPATFVTPPEDRKKGYEVSMGNPGNGKMIYDLSCKHCHEEGRYAFFELDDSWFSFRFLEKHFPRYTRYSGYQVIRYGTSPITGKRAYMPNYTMEKMSHQQLEDLRAYIEQQAD